MLRAALAIAGLALSVLVEPAAATALEPYRMVRSLQLVQDRLAAGDQAAMPMQRKLLEIIDARMRAAAPEEFGDRRNFRSIFIYAMSGGNPKTVDMLLSKLHLEGGDKALATGVVAYMAGAYGAARGALESMDPMMLHGELGPFVALIRGAVLIQENPMEALHLFDEARLLAPGTLVEEASLRRSVSIAATLGETDRFVRGSSQYVRRFLHSPYASQFAEAFVSGVVALHETVDLDAVAGIVDGMDEERAKTIYLRLARQSAIDGYERLLDFASAKANAIKPDAGTIDPRALLYSTIASVTSENVDEVRATLDGIDPARLSVNDQRLLKAASAVARGVLAHPEAAPRPAADASADGTSDASPAAASPAAAAAADAKAATIPAVLREAASEPASASNGAAGTQPASREGGTDDFVAEARGRLAQIDKLLEETDNE